MKSDSDLLCQYLLYDETERAPSAACGGIEATAICKDGAP